MNALALALATVVTVLLVVGAFIAVSRRLLGFPIGFMRALIAAGIAISVGSSLNASGRHARPAYLPLVIGVGVVSAMTFLVIAEALVPAGSVPSPLVVCSVLVLRALFVIFRRAERRDRA